MFPFACSPWIGSDMVKGWTVREAEPTRFIFSQYLNEVDFEHLGLYIVITERQQLYA